MAIEISFRLKISFLGGSSFIILANAALSAITRNHGFRFLSTSEIINVGIVYILSARLSIF